MRSVLHLLRANRQFLTGALLLGVVAVFALLSFFSPYPPNDSFVVPPDVPPSAEYWMGSTSPISSTRSALARTRSATP